MRDLGIQFCTKAKQRAGVMADYDRIRQGALLRPPPHAPTDSNVVLMNLIGNAVKFTANGYVRVTCSIDSGSSPSPGEVNLKFLIQYVLITWSITGL